MKFWLGVCVFLFALSAQASAPEQSPRPSLRGEQLAASGDRVRIIRVSASKLAPGLSLRPRARDAGVPSAETSTVPAPQPTKEVRFVQVLPGMASLRPKPRPKFVIRQAARTERAGQVQKTGLFNRKSKRQSAKGSVCGVPGIKGTKIAPIRGRIRGCGVSDPVAITSVGGVALSTPAKIDCGTAKALNSWVEKTVKPSVGRLGGGVSQLWVAAHYACRTRNNRKGAKISEHGKGRAIDISALTLKNGKRITVLDGWGRGVEGKILRKLHKGACGPFGTVLGPNSDKYHRDHFHFDTARYRSGAYCR